MWRAAFGLNKPSPYPAHHKIPVSSNVRPQLWISAHFVISARRRRLASQICKHGIEFGKPHCATYRSTVLIVLKNFCVVTFGAGHELTRKYNGVLPNWSLNRTLCGSPILGFKSLAQNRPTAKCRLARTLGVSNCQVLCRPNTPSPQEIFGPIGRCSWRPACLRECKTSFARHQISR